MIKSPFQAHPILGTLLLVGSGLALLGGLTVVGSIVAGFFIEVKALPNAFLYSTIGMAITAIGALMLIVIAGIFGALEKMGR